MIRFMAKWSLELTGASILLFNYQSYEKQQQMIGVYRAVRNSARTVYYLAGLAKEFKDLVGTSFATLQYSKKAEEFRDKSAETFERLCEVNQGVYARMGQIMSTMTGILPSNVLTSLQKLNTLTVPEVPYETVKATLTQTLQKPMKQLFDGFQTKPFATHLFWQEHKSILLQNYKQSLVKVMPLSTLYQSQYDFWFINKCLGYLGDYVRKNQPEAAGRYEQVEKVIKEAQAVTKNELSFKKQYQSAQQLGSLIHQTGSSFYIPYYYQKYANNSVIIRQFIEGVSLTDSKGLKQLGLSVQVAFAQIMSELHRMMNKYGLISGGLEPGSILIRKYIKPAKRKVENEGSAESDAKLKKKGNIVAKGRQLLHPQYQIVFLNLNNLQALPQATRQSIQNYWLSLKKKAKKVQSSPSVASYYSNIPHLKYLSPNASNLKDNVDSLLQEKYYLYEPMLRLYEQYVAGKGK